MFQAKIFFYFMKLFWEFQKFAGLYFGLDGRRLGIIFCLQGRLIPSEIGAMNDARPHLFSPSMWMEHAVKNLYASFPYFLKKPN